MSKYFTIYKFDGKCSNSCGNNDFIRTSSFFPVNYVCTSDVMTMNINIYTNKKKYCLKQCPEAAQYYYNDTKQCTAKCKNPYYTDEIYHIYFLTCPGLSTIDENKVSYNKCVASCDAPKNKKYIIIIFV